ncbi:MAG TPA: hypothetical protein VGE45_15530 [Chloroflexia bacterium]
MGKIELLQGEIESTQSSDTPTETASSITRTPRWWSYPNRRLNAMVAVLLLLLAGIFTAPGWWPGRVAVPMEQLLVFRPWQTYYPDASPIITGGDPILQQLPWRHWMQQELAAGRFPLWASSPTGGMPLFASAQPGVLYPLHLLWVLMPVSVGLGVVMALKLWLAGLGMWAFLRGMGLHPAASALGAVGLMFSGWMVNWAIWPNSSVYLLLPWLAWATYEWCEKGKRGALAWLALFTGLAVFGGHPETLFLMSVALAIWVVGLVVSGNRGQGYERKRGAISGQVLTLFSVAGDGSKGRDYSRWAGQIAGLAIAVGLGAALGAVQLLPFLQALELSRAATLRPADSANVGGVHLDSGMMLDWVLPRTWGHFSEGVLGGSMGFTEGNGYVGLVAWLGVVLAIAGAVRRQINLRLVVPWLVAGALAWLLAYDDAVGALLRSLPLVRQNINVRWISIVAFSALVVGAFGWDWLARHVAANVTVPKVGWLPQNRAGAVGLVLFVQGATLMAVHLAGWLPQPVLGEKVGGLVMVNDPYRLYWGVWALGVALATLGAAGMWAGSWRMWRVGSALVVLVLVLDLWRLLITVNITAPAELYYPETSFLTQVKAGVPATERILVEGSVMPANTGLVYGIRDWRAQDPMLSARAFQAALFLDPDLRKNGWDAYNMFLEKVRLQVGPMLGMRYVILPVEAGVKTDPNQPEEPDPGPPTFTRLASKDGLSLWRMEEVPGFAYLSDNVRAVATEKEAAEWMRQVTWEQVRGFESVVEAPANAIESLTEGTADGPAGDVVVQEYTPGVVRLEVKVARPALLVVAESWYPGWRGSVDGQQVEVLRANYLSQGVVVPAGTHTVELRYAPGAFTYGAIISVLGLLGIIALSVWARVTRKKG